MNTLKIEFCFGTGFDRNQNPLTVEERRFGLNQIKQGAVEIFGGYTLVDTEGGWRNPAGVLVEETGKSLVIYTIEKPSFIVREKIEGMISIIKMALRQETICVVQTPVNSEIR